MKDLYISEGAKFVLNTLFENGEEGYIVGGSVRDLLMGKEPSDFDITTSATPDRIEEIFSDCRLITLGKNYGTIGILYEDELIETTTFRSDGKYLDGRHPENVVFSKTLEEDLSRRDFTINSLAMDINGNIIDIFNGRDDIKNCIIRTVGNPMERFEEDKLRMLRAIRFGSRFKFDLEENTLKAIKELAPKISQVSMERIQNELNQIFLSEIPSQGIEILLETGLLGEIFPEIIPTVGYDQMSPYHHKSLFKHMLCVMDRVPSKLHLRLAAIFHDIAKVDTLSIDEDGIGHFYGHDKIGSERAEEILRRLKYDNKTIESVKILIAQHMKAQPEMGRKGTKRLINRVGKDLIFDLMDLMIADILCTREGRDYNFLIDRKKEIEEILNSKEVIDKRGLVINGKDLIGIGYKEGVEIGKVLNELTDLVLDDNNLNDRDKLLSIAKDKLENN